MLFVILLYPKVVQNRVIFLSSDATRLIDQWYPSNKDTGSMSSISMADGNSQYIVVIVDTTIIVLRIESEAEAKLVQVIKWFCPFVLTILSSVKSDIATNLLLRKFECAYCQILKNFKKMRFFITMIVCG